MLIHQIRNDIRKMRLNNVIVPEDNETLEF